MMTLSAESEGLVQPRNTQTQPRTFQNRTPACARSEPSQRKKAPILRLKLFNAESEGFEPPNL